jgi:hypothetical protein
VDVFILSDAAVPVSRPANPTVASQQLLRTAGIIGCVVGHLGDGRTGSIHGGLLVCAADQKEHKDGVVADVPE